MKYDRDLIKRLLRSGLRPFQIVEITPCTKPVISHYAKKMGISFTRGRILGKRNDLTFEKVKHIIRLKSEGVPYSKIAPEFGVSRQAIQQLIRPKIDNGRICQNCGNEHPNIHRHHVNYETEEIKLLCPKCHRMEHVNQPSPP